MPSYDITNINYIHSLRQVHVYTTKEHVKNHIERRLKKSCFEPLGHGWNAVLSMDDCRQPYMITPIRHD